MNKMTHKKIGDIVKEDYTFASVLFFFGIHFYNYSEKTLEQVCKEKGISVKKVVKFMENVHKESVLSISELAQFPIDIIIEYLKHSHFLFIKKRLPYLSNLIAGISNDEHDGVGKDLKFIFPFFVEDFIKHIYEEEDTLFHYILDLQSVAAKRNTLTKVYFKMEKFSIREFALGHSLDDDEMKGIRELTNNYRIDDSISLHLRVIYQELEAFEKELINHAAIENQVLFPKAHMLEVEISNKIKTIFPFN